MAHITCMPWPHQRCWYKGPSPAPPLSLCQASAAQRDWLPLAGADVVGDVDEASTSRPFNPMRCVVTLNITLMGGAVLSNNTHKKKSELHNFLLDKPVQELALLFS